MQLRDEIELWGETGPSPGYDDRGNELPAPVGKIATIPAHVYYSTAGVNFESGYGRLVAVEQLRAVVSDPGTDLQAVSSWIVWRGEEYRVDGVLDRSARGKTHHLTIELSQRT
ncbi:hypothetical protein [Leucobacter denitrificans]|uniref:Uncharacterized protein n=1 Tax=Leucobacter denitrificans TaxID=683042 RepID=A0A7G9S3C2_9MICO|nr:hypothetical protein [Leucobacter denitrificans]QNN62347.1 hypothetical protein H9L06_08750 [Leucobacter denitrificans]